MCVLDIVKGSAVFILSTSLHNRHHSDVLRELVQAALCALRCKRTSVSVATVSLPQTLPHIPRCQCHKIQRPPVGGRVTIDKGKHHKTNLRKLPESIFKQMTSQQKHTDLGKIETSSTGF